MTKQPLKKQHESKRNVKNNFGCSRRRSVKKRANVARKPSMTLGSKGNAHRRVAAAAEAAVTRALAATNPVARHGTPADPVR